MSSNFTKGFDKRLLYKVSSIMDYELDIFFIRETLTHSMGSVSSSIYIGMSEIQESCEVPSMIAIITSGASMQGFFRVSWMKE